MTLILKLITIGWINLYRTRYSQFLQKQSKSVQKLCTLWMLSFNNLHEMAGRATPEKLMTYKLALQLYRTFNYQTPIQDWLNINYNSVLTSRQTRFGINKSCRLKIGMNMVSNRFNYLNGKIDLNLLNLTYGTYKTHCKRLFLVWSSFPDDLLHVIRKLKWQVSSCWTPFAKHICWPTLLLFL